MNETLGLADGAVVVAPILEIRGVSKRFDATQALEDISLALHPGEIHALLGENGAGKSTLIKIITGVHQPDRGEILLAGQPVTIRSAAEAQRLGVAAIYQEPLLFPDLNVAENIFISHQDRGVVVDWRQMFKDAESILAELGVALDVRNPARGLTLAAQQSVEIAKAISLNVRILIMDEPTASLSAHEVQELFKLVRDLKRQGVAILFVSHRMEEVFEIADKVTVFRDGRLISTRKRDEATPQRAIADMVGREIDLTKARTTCARNDVVLAVTKLGRQGVFEGVTFDLHRGEVLGFAGLIGAGRTDVGLALFGIEPATSGTILLDAKPVSVRSPREGMNSRDRLRFGGPPPAWARSPDGDFRQYHLAGPASFSQSLRTRPYRRRAANRRHLPHPPRDPRALGRSRGRETVGWQPAEGHAEQMAQYQPLGLDSRRTDAWRRRGLQGRGARNHRSACGGGNRNHCDLVGSARSAGSQRPRLGHA